MLAGVPRAGEAGRGGGIHRLHGGVELAHRGEPGSERDVGQRQRGGFDEHPRGLRPVRPGQSERSGTQFGGEYPVELTRGVAQPGRQPGHSFALDHAVGDQPYRPGHQVTPQIPLRRARHGVGQAAPAGPVAGDLGGCGGGQEDNVLGLRCHRGARRPAVDAGGPHGDDEAAVEPGVARGDGSVAAVVVDQHVSIVPAQRTRYWRESDIDNEARRRFVVDPFSGTQPT